MYEQLFSRFMEAFKSSLEDPDIHLSYTDRQRLKAGEYAEVAAEKLPTLERRIYWTKVNAGVAAVLLALGAVLTAVSGAGVEPSWTLEEFFFPLFFAFCMGIAALGGMWRMVKLEKQRLLCELVVAQHEEETAEKTEKTEKTAAPPM
ncbi:hypothetical protein GGP91_002193 [Salinibacter ruber]|uniref:Uncharacterized protein n=2 Tax=Salinibacter ruber TaxID=146919 RepID=A0A9X2V8P7_9BACT|nr:hypothetical protein [Salinibacter ruber]MCS3662691.1 hypothetical protein [Salinibacter ruber]MCS3685779.1 hypothetical protein [Salinibacter ruber]MCS3704811.1 hypothetical protein [Salinibacter ruber]MCS3705361.1 hypothetical protein [Salinibacter ruber]MCS3830106.1 hypothetical protein [Salinibacter ruber]